MRKILIAAAAIAAVAVPAAAGSALAQPEERDERVYERDERAYERDERAYERDEADYEERWEDEEAARVDFDPRTVRQMAGAMDQLVGAVMDLPIGGIARAVDPYGAGNIPPGATVRDMATRDDPHAEARLRAGIRGTERQIGAMSEAFARALPVLERSFDQVSRDLEAAMDEVDSGRPY